MQIMNLGILQVTEETTPLEGAEVLTANADISPFQLMVDDLEVTSAQQGFVLNASTQPIFQDDKGAILTEGKVIEVALERADAVDTLVVEENELLDEGIHDDILGDKTENELLINPTWQVMQLGQVEKKPVLDSISGQLKEFDIEQSVPNTHSIPSKMIVEEPVISENPELEATSNFQTLLPSHFEESLTSSKDALVVANTTAAADIEYLNASPQVDSAIGGISVEPLFAEEPQQTSEHFDVELKQSISIDPATSGYEATENAMNSAVQTSNLDELSTANVVVSEGEASTGRTFFDGQGLEMDKTQPLEQYTVEKNISTNSSILQSEAKFASNLPESLNSRGDKNESVDESVVPASIPETPQPNIQSTAAGIYEAASAKPMSVPSAMMNIAEREVGVEVSEILGVGALASSARSDVEMTTNPASAATVISQTVQAEFSGRFAAQLSEVAKTLPDQPIELTLTPEELGKVKLTFQVSETGAMNVIIAAERPETLELMKRNADSLLQDFRELGYENSNFSFQQEHRDEDHSNDSQHGNPHTSGSHENPQIETQNAPTGVLQPVRLTLDVNASLDMRL